MFKGEFISLEEIEKTNKIRVPHPVSVIRRNWKNKHDQSSSPCVCN